MSSFSRRLDSEQEPLLHDSNIPSESKEQEANGINGNLAGKPGMEKSYSVQRVVVVLCVFSIFSNFGLAPASTLLSQYMVKRLTVNGTNSTNYSVCNSNASDSRVQEANAVQAQVSQIILYFTYVSSFPGLVSSIFFGCYTDYIGRRILMLGTSLAFAFKLAIQASVIKFGLDLNILYVGYLADGISGSFYVYLIGMYCITADITAGKDTRILSITVLTAFNYILASASSIVNGYLIEVAGFFMANVVLFISTFLSLLVIIFFLPETLPVPEEKMPSFKRNIRRLVSFFMFDRSARFRLTFIMVLVLFFFGVFNDLAVGSIDTLYQMHLPFCWSPTYIGYYAAVKNGGSFLIGSLLMAALQKCMKSEHIGQGALLFQAGAYVFEAFAKTTLQLYFVPVLGIPSVLTIPTIRGMSSVLAGPRNQGASFACIAVLEAVCNLVSTTVYNNIYAGTVDIFAGTSYLVMAGVSIFTFFLFFVYYHVHEDSFTNTELSVDVDSGDKPGSIQHTG